MSHACIWLQFLALCLAVWTNAGMSRLWSGVTFNVTSSKASLVSGKECSSRAAATAMLQNLESHLLSTAVIMNRTFWWQDSVESGIWEPGQWEGECDDLLREMFDGKPEMIEEADKSELIQNLQREGGDEAEKAEQQQELVVAEKLVHARAALSHALKAGEGKLMQTWTSFRNRYMGSVASVIRIVHGVASVISTALQATAAFDISKLGQTSSSSMATVVADDAACRGLLTQVMRHAGSKQITEKKLDDHITYAADCIREDMDKCVVKLRTAEELGSVLQTVQSFIDQFVIQFETRKAGWDQTIDSEAAEAANVEWQKVEAKNAKVFQMQYKCQWETFIDLRKKLESLHKEVQTFKVTRRAA